MADTPYPHYRLQADGPGETGITLIIQTGEGAAGPLAGLTQFGVVQFLRDYLVEQGATVAQLTRYEVATTYDL